MYVLFSLEYIAQEQRVWILLLTFKMVNAIDLEPHNQTENSDVTERKVRLCHASSSKTLVLPKMGKEHPFPECSSYCLALGLKKDQHLPGTHSPLWPTFLHAVIKGTRGSSARPHSRKAVRGKAIMNKSAYVHLHMHVKRCILGRNMSSFFSLKNVFLYSLTVLYNMVYDVHFHPQFLSLSSHSRGTLCSKQYPTPCHYFHILLYHLLFVWAFGKWNLLEHGQFTRVFAPEEKDSSCP